ncbi:MAG: protein kinase [Planctomycetota bacterium]
MSERPPAASSEHDPDSDDLQSLFERFLAREVEREVERGGGPPSVEDLVSQHPDHEEGLRALWRERGPVGSSARFHGRGKKPGSSPRTLSPGDRLGDVRLVRYIAKGGMGEVWEGYQDRLQRRVAIKVVRPDKESDRARLRFELEAIAGARMNHPGIVAVYGNGVTDGIGWISMEYVDGCWTLFDFLSSLGAEARLSPDHFPDVARLLLKITVAMETAHAAGVIHRDLKPQNVLITPEDEPKIADFGLARLTDVPGVSEPGDLVGSYYYMSPEQVTADRIELDHRTDVFSLGVIAYELLTLKLPFEGATAKAISRQILLKDPPAPRRIRPEVPRVLDVLTMKCLEKDPDDRFYSMAVLGEQLRRYLAGEPVPIEPVGPVRRAWRRLKRDRTRAAALAGVALVAVAGWFASQVGTERDAREAAERDTLYARAERALELNEIDEVRRLIDLAIDLDGNDPLAHLILADAYAKYGRVPDRDAELDLAIAKGFQVPSLKDPDSSAAEHMAGAKLLLQMRDAAAYAPAKDHLRRALELEPSRYAAHYDLYLILVDEGDRAGALSHLQEFKDRLPTGIPFWTVTEALELELQGDGEGACRVLESLRAREGLSEDDLRDLRVARHLGRNYVNLGRLDDALPELEQAITTPGDCWSLGAFAAYWYKQYQRDEPDLEALARMREAAEEALACSPSLVTSRKLLAFAEIEAFALADPGTGPPRSTQEWRRARAAVDALRTWHPGHAELPRLESKLCYAEGLRQGARLEHLRAASCFLAAADHDAEEIRPWISLAEVLVWVCTSLDRDVRASSHPIVPLTTAAVAAGAFTVKTHAHGVGHEAAAVAHPQWEQASDPATRRLFAAFAVWGFRHASAQCDPEHAQLWKERIDAQLDSPETMDPVAEVNYAEALGALCTHESVRDPERALEIMVRHEHLFVGTQYETEFRRMMELVREAAERRHAASAVSGERGS